MCTKLENLWKLRDAAWASFQRRAGHEFKFSLAVWTAAVVLIGLVIKGEVHSVPFLVAIFGPAIFVVLHCWYECGMARSNDMDLDKCYDLEDAIRTEINHTWSKELQERINKKKSQTAKGVRCRALKNWSHVGHVGITAILAFIAAVLLCTAPSKSGTNMDKAVSASPETRQSNPSDSRLQQQVTEREAVPHPADRLGHIAVLQGDIVSPPGKRVQPTGAARSALSASQESEPRGSGG